MAPFRFSTRWLVALLCAVIVFEAGATSPAPVLAQEPSAPPTAAPVTAVPSPSAEPGASSEPAATPTATPSQPDATPSALPPGPADGPVGVERVDMRTASSRTFEQTDGTFVTEYYAEDLFYKPEANDPWQPIEARFTAGDAPGVAAQVEHSPVQIALSAIDAIGGFLTMTGGGHTVSFGLPEGTPAGRSGDQPVISADGLVADYADFLPGGIGLRIFPRADGFKSFLVLPAKPSTNTFSFAIDAGDLALAAAEDGTLTFSDGLGKTVGRIPRPFMLDSSELEGRGGGVYTEAVTQTLSGSTPNYVVTLTIDPAFLETAVYPVYVDPTTTTFPTGCTCTANDTFAAERYPDSSFDSYARPDWPYYNEMWHGNEPGYTTYGEVFIRFLERLDARSNVGCESCVP